MSKKCTVIGLTGPLASGKEVVARQLIEKGFSWYELSDPVREETQRRHLPQDRKTLQDVGNDLRQTFGNDILAKRLAGNIEKTGTSRVVIDGIRNPGEIDFLKKKFNATIIGITASPAKRFQWSKTRGRRLDPMEKEAFATLERRDRGIGQEDYGQQVDACVAKADIVIENNGTIEDLKKKMAAVLNMILSASQPRIE